MLYLNFEEIGELLGMSAITIRTYLCRPEFNKFRATATDQDYKTVFLNSPNFWKELYNFLDIKGNYKAMKKVKGILDGNN